MSGERVTRGGGLAGFDFIGLCLVIFLTYCNTTVFYSLYLHLQGLGVAEDWRGFLIGASSLATIACFLAFSHRLGRRNASAWAMGGAVLLALCGAGYLLVRGVPGLLAVRLAGGAGVYLLSASCMTLLVAVVDPQRFAQAISLYSVAYLLPYSTVPALFDALSGTLPRLAPGYAPGYALMAVTMIPALWVIGRVGRAARAREGGSAGEARVGYREMWVNAARPQVALLLTINTVYIVAFSSLFFMAKGLFQARGYPNVGYFFTIQTLAMIGVRLLGNRVFDRLPKAALIRTHFVLSAAGFGLAALCGSLPWMYAAAGCIGVGMGVGSPAIYALMFKLSEPRFQAINANLLMLSLQLGNFAGPVLGAAAVHALGYAGFLWLDVAASLAGLACCLALTSRRLDPQGLARSF